MRWVLILLGAVICSGALLLAAFRRDARDAYLRRLRMLRLQPAPFLPPMVVVWAQVVCFMMIGLAGVALGVLG